MGTREMKDYLINLIQQRKTCFMPNRRALTDKVSPLIIRNSEIITDAEVK